MNYFNDEKTEVEAGVTALIGGHTYIVRDGGCLGREGTVAREYFEDIKTVSRIHCYFSKKGGRWYITVPESVANSTMLDGVEIRRGEPILLMGEHILKMSEQCVVRLKA